MFKTRDRQQRLLQEIVATVWRCLMVLMVGLACSLPSQATQILRVLTWPGYADNDLVKAFEKQQGVRVEVSFVSSDEVLRKKISANQGGDFDVFAANTAELQHYIGQKLVVALRLANIPNTAHQLPRFRDARSIPGITQLGEVYAVPYTYSEMGLIFDRKQFRDAATSLSAMWDPQYRGRVLAFNTSSHNFSIASLLLGGQPFRIEDQNFKKVVNHLIALRRNALTFYTLPEESVEQFRQHSAALLFANYGRQQFKLLRDAGADVGYVIPVEGALAWLDCWAVTRGVKNKALAERWINYMLDKKVSAELTRRHGLSNTIEAETALQPTDKLIWLEPVEDDKRRATLWDRIMSGDVPAKF